MTEPGESEDRNPYQTPTDATPPDDTAAAWSLSKTIYVHITASVGALVAMIGGFGAVFVLPMFIQTLAASRLWVTVFLIAGILFGLLAAFLSYRATLRTYSK